MPVENLVLPKKLEDGHDIKLARQAFGEDNNITFEDVLTKFGLMRSANIVMPNLTPPKYRVLYEIYPDKACANETAEQCGLCMEQRIESIGRQIGSGPGGRRRN